MYFVCDILAMYISVFMISKHQCDPVTTRIVNLFVCYPSRLYSMATGGSVASASTRGGCSFEDLCRGSQSYACDNLINIEGLTIRKQEDDLSEHIRECIESIEFDSGCPVEKFYIGKTHVRQRKDRAFDPTNSTTWRLDDGINGRFRDHRGAGYGRDGLVVLTVVTAEAIPLEIRQNKPNFHQEDYALALESRLILRFMSDPRLVNETTEAGRRDRTRSIGYPLYMAFRVRDDDDNPPWVFEDDDNPPWVFDDDNPPWVFRDWH